MSILKSTQKPCELGKTKFIRVSVIKRMALGRVLIISSKAGVSREDYWVFIPGLRGFKMGFSLQRHDWDWAYFMTTYVRVDRQDEDCKVSLYKYTVV